MKRFTVYKNMLNIRGLVTPSKIFIFKSFH